MSGEKVLEKEWDYNIIPKNASLMRRRYSINFGKEIIPEDQDMLDRLFVAGIDMLITTGMYNKDTGTRMMITEDEVYEGIKMAPKKLILGEGKDAVECTARRGNTMQKPIIEGGPTGAPVSEAIYSTLIESYAQEHVVDTIVTGVLETVRGHQSIKNTPWEVRATMHELTYTHNALVATGRSGMAI